MILHTSPNNVTSFWIRNRHLPPPPLHRYQLLLIFHVDLSTKGIPPIPPFLMILLNNILPKLLSNIQRHGIILYLNIRAPFLPFMFLKHICIYLLNKTYPIKTRQIHTFFKHAISFIYIIPINSQQFTSFFFWEV